MLRFLNILFSHWLLVSPWVLAGASSGAMWNSLLAGIGIILLSFPKGRIRESAMALMIPQLNKL